MLIAFGKYQAKMDVWKDKLSLITYLKDCQRGYIILGENEIQENHFYSLEILFGDSILDKFGVGICSQGHGLIPNILFLPQKMSCVLGFNFNVVFIDINNLSVIEKIDLDSLFYRFFPIYDQDLIIVVQEIGVIALTNSGKRRWQFIKDVITNAKINNSELFLEFMDSNPVQLNILDGKPKS